MAAAATLSTPTSRLFDSLPATIADLGDAECEHFLEDFLTGPQLARLVTEDYCFVCRRSTDHRGEDHVATQANVARFAASVSV